MFCIMKDSDLNTPMCTSTSTFRQTEEYNVYHSRPTANCVRRNAYKSNFTSQNKASADRSKPVDAHQS
jgi:hypothetical protein